MAPTLDHHRRIMDELLRRGAKEVQLVKGKKHPHISFTYHGRSLKYFTSLSPSDYRATAKAISDVRRLLKEEQKR